MNDALRFVNAFIGFCTPMGGTWPDPLLPLAYQVVGVEREIHTSLNGQPRMVVPELVCASKAVNHVFCLEAKSATLSVGQAQKYLAITGTQLEVSGSLPPGLQAATLSHDTLCVTLPMNAATLVAEMVKQGTNLPVITGDATRFALFTGTIGQPTMQQEFYAGINIQPNHQWPTHFVPFNRDATVAQLAAPVIRTLSQFLLRPDTFTTQNIAESVSVVPHWQHIGTQERNAFLNKIHGILERAQREELKPYFKPMRPPKRVRPPRNTPWTPVGKRPMSTNTTNALQRDATQFVQRQQTGMPFRKRQPPLPGLS